MIHASDDIKLKFEKKVNLVKAQCCLPQSRLKSTFFEETKFNCVALK